MKIKALIFDLGGVLIDVDYDNIITAFEQLGATNAREIYTQAEQKDYVDEFECGKMTSKEFLINLRKDLIGLRDNVTDQQIVTALCAIMGNFQAGKLQLLKYFREQGYKIFLFSNINEMHYDRFIEVCQQNKILKEFEAAFDERYFSHLFGYNKPFANSFSKVAEAIKQQYHLEAKQMLFIDDSKKHIHGRAGKANEGAIAAGLHGLHVNIKNPSSEQLKQLIEDTLYDY